MFDDKDPLVNTSDKKVLPTTPNHGVDDEAAAKKKKKMLIGGGVAIALVALIIILVCTVGGSDDPDNPPPPPPPPPPVGPGYNPYNIDQGKLVQTVSEVTGVIDAGSDVHAKILARREQLKKQGVKATEKPDLIDPSTIKYGENNQIFEKVRFAFGQVDYTIAKMMLTNDDENNWRWNPPSDLVNSRPDKETMRLDMCGFDLKTDEAFSFEFKDSRSEDGDFYLSTEGQSLLLMDKYMQMDFKLPSQRLFGLGERNREFQLTEGTWTMFANGQETPYDDGTGGLQGYGVHPFLLFQTKTKGNYVGMYFRNSNAQSPVIKYNDDGTSTFSYISTGGELEVYFFFKGSAVGIIKQYQNFIGLPSLPPFWSLGWNAASYGYQTLADIQKNVDSYAAADIPLEGVWLDIPYMDDYSDFTVDQTNWKDLDTYTKSIQQDGKRMIVIVDAGIDSKKGGPAEEYFTEARINDTLLKSTINTEEGWLNGSLSLDVWPKKTVFIDFFNKKGVQIWEKGLTDLFAKVNFDGLWLDMNEVTGFCNGECPNLETSKDTQKAETKRRVLVGFLDQESDEGTWFQSYDQDKNSTYFLPFIPGPVNFDNMTMSLNATHPESGYTQYNTHNLNGLIETKKTREWMTQRGPDHLQGNRSFILSRSTFSGSGAYTQHWLGDNHREWAYMNYSIAGVMNMNMFGIPMVGPDTCGFFKARTPEEEKTQDELCGRWMQLATFYPFARQHRDTDEKHGGRGGKATEPYTLPPVFQSWSRNAIRERLTYIRHMYTCLFRVSQEGGTCYDPLFFHYPNDDNLFDQMEHSFIMGDAFKVSPVLKQGVSSFQSYFPAGDWVDMHDYSKIISIKCPDSDGFECMGTYGEWVKLTTDVKDENDMIKTHLVPGSIAVIQPVEKPNLTTDVLDKSVTLVANRDYKGVAEGKLFLDDGYSLSTLENGEYEYYNFLISANSIKKQVLNERAEKAVGPKITEIVLTNAEDLATVNFACMAAMDSYTLTTLKPTYNKDKKTLTFTLDGGEIDPFAMRDIYYGDDSKDLNMCQADGAFYHAKDFKAPDLTKNTVDVTLQSDSKALKDLKLTLSVLENGLVSLYYNYADDKDLSRKIFEVPDDIINAGRDKLMDKAVLSDYVVVTQDQDKPIQIDIQNKDKTKVFSLTGFALNEYYNYRAAQTFTNPASKGIIGLGEKVTENLFVGDGVYSFWARDVTDPPTTGKLPGTNLYGTHPFFMAQGTDSKWFGVFTNLAAAQDWWIKRNTDTGAISINAIAVGGVVDMYFMFGDDPNAVVKTYHNSVVGKPVLTPQWILGWNQCRWGYKNLDTLKEVVKNYSDNGIPLDTQWSDIDYLDKYRDFTVDPLNFDKLGDFVDELHGKDMHYIPIIDAGVAQRASGYDAFNSGVQNDAFLKAHNGEIFTGQVWPGDAAYPDYSHDKTPDWWHGLMDDLQNKIHFDGLWEDMNEASNFCVGACYDSQVPLFPSKYKLPYIPTGRDLEVQSMQLDVQHSDGNIELDYHSLYGTQMIKTTHDWFTNNQKRPMIIERSAFAGAGKYASRWLGDNSATETYMGESVTGIMMHNIFGIPLSGSDICGFLGDTNPELCARWHVVGSFYPFSRNHNDINGIPQEPWVFKKDIYEGQITYFDIIKNAIQNKYNLIRYYYTQLGLVSKNGGAFYKPLFFEFPGDAKAYDEPQYNIMLGEALKLSLLTDKLGADVGDSMPFYFPAGTWCNIYNSTDACFTSTGETKDYVTKAYAFQLHLRDGYIVPLQDAKTLKAMTSKDLQDHPVDLHINPACDANACSAKGSYLNDDGVTTDVDHQRNIYDLTLTGKASDVTLGITNETVAETETKGHINMNDVIGTVQIYNAKAQGFDGDSTVKITMWGDAKAPTAADAKYDSTLDRLVWTAPTKDDALYMADVASIEFTKK